MDDAEKIRLLELDVERKREERDNLNESANEWRNKRESLNAEVRELISKANECRDKRDEYNKNVKEAKEKRDEWNNGSNETITDKSLMSKQLRKQLSDLEYTLQTQNLNKGQEMDIVKKIKSLKEEIKGYEMTAEQSTHRREDVNTHRESVIKYANLAQEEHDKMKSLFERADDRRKDADEAHNNFLECKKDADVAHKEYLELVQKVKTSKKEGIRKKDNSRRYNWF